jgi:thioredoxin reductase (NADPH)
MAISTDAVIIGAGPCGLFQVFELGLLGMKAHVIDALPKAGGQCVELYPDKPIYDIPALPIVGAQELIDRLHEQIKPFHPEFHLGEQVSEVKKKDDGRFFVRTSAGTEFDARSVIIAAGVGAFQPVELKLPGIEKYVDKQMFYRVRDPARFAGRDVVILGGGDSALDWTHALFGKAKSITLVHRSDKFRAQNASVDKMHALVREGKMKFLAGHITAYAEDGGVLRDVTLKTVEGPEHKLAFDDLLVFFGLHPKLGPIAEWGLDLEKHTIKVDTEKFQTSVPGIYAIGDINTYPGKKKLILSGFHEAALAAFAIKAQLNPGEKVHLQYTTTSPIMHKRLGVEDPFAAEKKANA